MTIPTIGGRRTMIARLPSGNHPIMATGARTNHLSMVHTKCGYPGRRTMTGLTHIRRRNVVWRLAPRRGAIVTTAASRHDPGMIKRRRDPGDRTVTAVTLRSSRYVIGRLAGGDCPVMAG